MIAAAELSPDEKARYLRQVMLPEIGVAGQQRLKAARVLCIGAGGLGSPAVLYLASAGVGLIGIVDDDRVEPSNLHRQVVHGTNAVGLTKLESAQRRIADQNPHVHLVLHDCRFGLTNAGELVRDYDIVIDGSDNFPTRYASNDACVAAAKPNIYGSVFQFEGQASVFAAHLGGPCYRCHFPEPPPAGAAPSCAEAGVLGVLPGLIGMIQATEALKLLLGIGEPLVGRLLHLDAKSMRFREFTLRRNPNCIICGNGATTPAASPRHAADIIPSVSVYELDALQKGADKIVLVDVREPFEREIAAIRNAIPIPLGELDQRANALERTARTIVFCHSGIRSAYAVNALRQRGFTNVWNLTGGIDAWSREIDPTVQRY